MSSPLVPIRVLELFQATRSPRQVAHSVGQTPTAAMAPAQQAAGPPGAKAIPARTAQKRVTSERVTPERVVAGRDPAAMPFPLPLAREHSDNRWYKPRIQGRQAEATRPRAATRPPPSTAAGGQAVDGVPSLPKPPRRRPESLRKASSGHARQNPGPVYPFLFMLVIIIRPGGRRVTGRNCCLIFNFNASLALKRLDLEVPTEIESISAISSCL